MLSERVAMLLQEMAPLNARVQEIRKKDVPGHWTILLADDDGARLVEFDVDHVDDTATMRFSSAIGAPDEKDDAAVYGAALAFNHKMAQTDGYRVAMTPDGYLSLMAEIALPQLQPADLGQRVEAYAVKVLTWQSKIATGAFSQKEEIPPSDYHMHAHMVRV